MKLKTKVRGIDALFSFFAENEQSPYSSPHNLIAQINDDACVAACARMILADLGIDAPESYLAAALETADGAYLSSLPRILKEFGAESGYEYRRSLTPGDLSKALNRGYGAAVSVRRENTKFGHSVIVDYNRRQSFAARPAADWTRKKLRRFARQIYARMVKIRSRLCWVRTKHLR